MINKETKKKNGGRGAPQFHLVNIAQRRFVQMACKNQEVGVNGILGEEITAL